MERRSVSDMKQITTGMLIYRENWKTTDYGDMAAMGLPFDYRDAFGKPGKDKTGTWPVPPMHPDDFPLYYSLVVPKEEDARQPNWEQAVARYGDSTLLVCDPWLKQQPTLGRWASYDATLPNVMNGISLGGNLLKKKPYGAFIDFTRWGSSE